MSRMSSRVESLSHLSSGSSTTTAADIQQMILNLSPTQSNPLLPKAPASVNNLKNPLKSESGRSPNVLTILNTLHPDLFIPYRQMGWNLFDTIRTNFPFIYRINDGASNNFVLQRVCEERGWQEFKDQVPKVKASRSRIERELYENTNWNLWWSYNFYSGSPYRTLKCWQYTNHNPRAFQFCSKSYLTSFLRKMAEEFGEICDFIPKGFCMPEDYIKFVAEHSKRQEKDCPEAKNVVAASELCTFEDPNAVAAILTSTSPPGDKKGSKAASSTLGNKARYPIWIIKPLGKSQGKGIILTKDIGVVASSHRCVVQEYIARPHLIGGFKWDIRIYVCITSTDPLVIYMYREGLCRFATEKFDMANLQACYSHLTNSSLNKLGPDYPTDKEVIGPGCKWSLKQLRAYLRKERCRDWLLWQKIMSLVLLTVVGEGLKSGYMFPASRNCFDFFGFDILVDSKFQPWLLEVNYSPGLGGDLSYPVDENVKRPMLHELFDLMGFPNCSETRPSSASSTTSLKSKEKKKPRPKSTKPKLALDCTNVDVSCKARLKEASLIYSQDLVLEYFGNHCRNPKFRLSPTMRIMYERKIAHAKRRKRFDKLVEKMRKDEADKKLTSGISSNNDGDDENDDESNEDESSEESEKETPRPPTANHGGKKPEEFIYINRQDWTEPPLEQGNWCLVYPCQSLPYRSPYRSALGDLRTVVKSMEHYLAVAESIVNAFPDEKDEFYESKVRAMCRWNIGIWAPPGPSDGDESIIPVLR